MNIKNLIRQNVQKLEPYTCARDLYKEGIFLDANENPQQWVDIDWSKLKNLNRYPDSNCDELMQKLIDKYLNSKSNFSNNISKNNVFIGAGSDEIIDLLIRGFVEDDEYIMIMDPSYSVYEVQAEINNVKVKKILLNPNFSLNLNSIKKNIEDVKLIFLCSPNNPTGNLVTKNEFEKIMRVFDGIIVIDEAYIEFAGLDKSMISLLKDNKKLVILRTFSKAWGLAGVRLGYAIADPVIIKTLSKIKDSYNTTKISQFVVFQALDQTDKLNKSIDKILRQKTWLENKLRKRRLEVIKTYANFILVKIPDATNMYKKLANRGVIVRDRSKLPYLENVLRISIGTKKQNKLLIGLLDETI